MGPAYAYPVKYASIFPALLLILLYEVITEGYFLQGFALFFQAAFEAAEVPCAIL
jgi:hypothetical protein